MTRKDLNGENAFRSFICKRLHKKIRKQKLNIPPGSLYVIRKSR